MAISRVSLDGSNSGIRLTGGSLAVDVLTLDLVTGALASGVDDAGLAFISDNNLRALKVPVSELFDLVPVGERVAGALGLLTRLCSVVPADASADALSAVNIAGDVYALRVTVAATPANLVAHVTTSIDGGMNAGGAGAGGGGGGAPSGPAGGVLGYVDSVGVQSTYPNPSGLTGTVQILPPDAPIPANVIPLTGIKNEAQIFLPDEDPTSTAADVETSIGMAAGMASGATPGVAGGNVFMAAGSAAQGDVGTPGGYGGSVLFSAGDGGDSIGAPEVAGGGGAVQFFAGSAGQPNGGGGAAGGTIVGFGGFDSDDTQTGWVNFLGGGAAALVEGASVYLGCYGADDPANLFGGRPPSPVEIHGALKMAYKTVDVPDAGTTIDPGGSAQNVSYVALDNTSGGPVTLTSEPTVPAPDSALLPDIVVNVPDPMGGPPIPVNLARDTPRLLILENISADTITLQRTAALAGSNLLLQGDCTLGQYGKLTLMWSPAAQKWVEQCRTETPT